MEEERRSEEETSHHSPFQFLNEAIKSFMECLGLHISPPPYYSASSEAPNGIAATRGMIVRLKQRGRETPSSGRPGRHN
ncbi:hypothetical protein Bca52824_056829 [Brassica carinata]|uniref:Uncharacterized protein n=2 Tax=Brassica TaxID=3705 RepID=A0A0D3EGL8_BRAOL|nr:hypothetical protein Bca52824_056829 [Brassica carinata]